MKEIALEKGELGYDLTIGAHTVGLTEEEFQRLYKLLFDEHFKGAEIL